MHRTIDYHADLRPANRPGPRQGHHHPAERRPEQRLPDGVIGSNGQGLPLGTNRTYLSFYTPLGLQSWSENGTDLTSQTQSQLEFGYHVYSRYIQILSGQTVTLTLDLDGTLAASMQYRLGVAVQPMINADQIHVTVTPTSGWSVSSATTLFRVPNGSEASFWQGLGLDTQASAEFAPR